MQIKTEKNIVELIPESDTEKQQLNALWEVVVDCAKFNKKLVAIGEYGPGKDSVARFAVED